MRVQQDRYRPLLNAALWLAAIGTALAAGFWLVAGSTIALALGLQLALVATAVWAVRDMEAKRNDSAPGNHPPLQNTPRSNNSSDESVDRLISAAQTERIVLGSVASIVGVLALLHLLSQALGVLPNEPGIAAPGIFCLAVTFVWLVISRSLASISPEVLPGANSISLAFREAQWCGLLSAAAFLLAPVYPLVPLIVGRLLLIWVAVIAAEYLTRMIGGVFVPPQAAFPVAPPVQSLLRQSLFAASNPLHGASDAAERWLGVSLRSNWAITFIKRSVLPLAALLALLAWGLTSLTIVETHQMGVREHLGRVAGEPLKPGLHVSLPWPLGRIRAFPVKTVQQLPIGFVESDETLDVQKPRTLLWTRPHAKEEFALVLGGGSELVAVNASVYFKIAEDRDQFLNYVYRQFAAEEFLTAFAYRALMEETRGRTLDEVLSADRAQFSRRIAQSVRQQARAAALGLEVVDFAMLNQHPPMEAGGSYLDVINARLDAGRRVTEAEGVKQTALLSAQTRSASAVAAAQAERSRRVSAALGEVAEFRGVITAKDERTQLLRLRLWIESLENALVNQRLFLVDRTLLDEGGEILLDTRRIESGHLPSIDSVVPNMAPGESK